MLSPWPIYIWLSHLVLQCLRSRRWFRRLGETPSSSSQYHRSPKLSLPTFNGNILQWKTFWDLFEIRWIKTRGPWWFYIAHLSKQICILTVEVSAKFTALRFLYKFYSPAPHPHLSGHVFFNASWRLELNLERGSPKEHFCQVILKLVQWFLTKRFLKCFI